MKTHAGENLVLGAARRSIRCTDVLLLGNGSIITRNKPENDISKVASMVLDLIVKPLREIQINDYEFACLKAIVFFDPGNIFTLNTNFFKIIYTFELKLKNLILKPILRFPRYL